MAKPTTPSSPAIPVDWAHVHARLSLASTDAAHDPATQAARDAEILARRARALAQPPAPTEDPREERMLVVGFELGGQSLALDASVVRETVLLRELAPLPGLPPFVRGLANVRSRVLPAFDLRPLLQLPARTASSGEKLLIVAWDGAEFALIADEVTSSQSLSLAGLRREVPGLNQKYLRGLSHDGHLLLDFATLFPSLRVGDDATL